MVHVRTPPAEEEGGRAVDLTEESVSARQLVRHGGAAGRFSPRSAAAERASRGRGSVADDSAHPANIAACAWRCSRLGGRVRRGWSREEGEGVAPKESTPARRARERGEEKGRRVVRLTEVEPPAEVRERDLPRTFESPDSSRRALRTVT